jgi:hypothetical protein
MIRRLTCGLAVSALCALGPVLASTGAASAAGAVGTLMPGIYHVPVHLHGHGVRGTVESTNWSGYAINGTTGEFTAASGSWVQPTATCSSRQTAYAAFWVGIDGYSSNSVEQLGTDSDCHHGKPTYYGWYEMYPNPSYEISTSAYPVHPGDSMSASVTVTGGTSFTLSMHDATSGWTFSITESSSGLARSSAEWIAEAPSSCSVFSCTVLPLANFGTVNFANSTANGATIASYTSNNYEEITMVTSGGTVKAQPSSLGSDGESFSDTWHHS